MYITRSIINNSLSSLESLYEDTENLVNETEIHSNIENKPLLFRDIKSVFKRDESLSWHDYTKIVNETLICIDGDTNLTLAKIKGKIKNKKLKEQLTKINELTKKDKVDIASLNQCLMFLNSNKLQKGEFFVDPVDGNLVLYYNENNRVSNKSLTISFTGHKKINFNIVDRKQGLTRMNGYLVMKDNSSFYRIDELFKIF
ncbi:hypothetical protein [Acinetobacter sp. 3657]|uniref:hypothetical protein n=1 Tax=Acinetobacter sp. 3657 TaxID=2817764 RepID=UPI0028556F26|nr:hypothetical protein [Prolinoborus sp. 3657]